MRYKVTIKSQSNTFDRCVNAIEFTKKLCDAGIFNIVQEILPEKKK